MPLSEKARALAIEILRGTQRNRGLPGTLGERIAPFATEVLTSVIRFCEPGLSDMPPPASWTTGVGCVQFSLRSQ